MRAHRAPSGAEHRVLHGSAGGVRTDGGRGPVAGGSAELPNGAGGWLGRSAEVGGGGGFVPWTP
ncbi:hypothetical protein SCATT_00380 [Streptantibioticus cattleyicolor NRRL 8057 = DSM 46488]|uniref:Uncharacterized protein n=1 Tax=Streptantibioticus cattleyicolor (strain ATCC 35852 / DSM 46488 / JCM 4925 / NBRC 14057 / NRRL 8057) TaxID=1003195 RepID=G8WVW5_STREN|nr:hypothetical protein SCATT_00380 [Streptantibioticus cattleyicolor NRRL 8057 = DSM 46488]